MSFDRHSRAFGSALSRSAVHLLLAAQLLLAFAPLMEWQFGADACAHVEAAGTNAHHAHNPADCIACAARGLLATSPSAPPAIESARSVPPGLSARDEHFVFLTKSQSRPRAPPLRQA
ncbi:MAG TPA: hypothetical protein VD771_08575 [Gemmatimonadaceae bacterium]|nr:hypothetical protein [Gemmatimonadaceae bacterium]